MFQGVGTATSILSVTKGVAEWWVRAREKSEENDELKISDATLGQTLKVFPFFLPHVLFRTSALAFTAAFLGYWTLLPLILTIITVWITSCVSLPDDNDDSWGVTCCTTVFAPFAFLAYEPNDRAVMKRAIVTFTTSLMFCLTIIRLLPVFSSPSSLVSTYGLRHLNFANASGDVNFN